MLSFPEVHELSDDVRKILEEFDRRPRGPCHGVSSVYAPALDVVETPTSIEVHLDVPGVAVEAIRVFIKNGNLVIVGEKLSAEGCGGDGSAFHLVERGFGRFARVVRLHTAIDASRAQAVVRSGELRITVPRIDDRRGQEIMLRVEEKV
jgi:HSP20 family protein